MQAGFYRVDIRSPEAYSLIWQTRPSVICPQAAQVSVRDSVAYPAHDASSNILGSLNLRKAAIQARVEKFITIIPFALKNMV